MKNPDKYKTAKVFGQRFDLVNKKQEDFRKMRRKRRIRAREIQSEMIVSGNRRKLKESFETNPTSKIISTGMISSLNISPGDKQLVDMGVAFVK